MTTQKAGKGQMAEEELRIYFISLGYFVVRSVPFTYKGFDVTDVDLWLYLNTSTLTRERICVDIKKKKTPQALERVFWIKGLREVLNLDRAIVATTDNRKETRDFGASHDVTVLSGEFLKRLNAKSNNTTNRIIEEFFLADLKSPCILNSKIDWGHFYREAKANLLMALDFNGCNLLLDKIRFLIDEYLASSKTSKASLRLLYVLTAYLLITIDYSSRLITPLDIKLRKEILSEGFRYGAPGKDRADEIVKTALQLLSDTSSTDLFSKTKLEKEIEMQLSEYPAEILAEYFAKPETLKQLFLLAREFEALSFSDKLLQPHECPSSLKAILAILCDFFKIDRRKLI